MFIFSTTVNAKEAFDIINYNVDVNITDERIYEFSENIETFFNEQRHGIIRSIPTAGDVEDYKIKNIEVIGDSFSKSKYNGNLELQIGDADEYVSGEKVYNIKYSLCHIQDDASDGDYVYINLIGTEWDTTIQNANITITLPTDKIESVNLTSGDYMSKSNVLSATHTISGNTVTINAHNFNPHNGLTAMIKMPDGVFANAPESFYPFSNYVACGIAAFAIILLLAVIIKYFRYGKDKQVIPIVEYYPPDNLNSAEIGYIVDQTADSIDLTSLVLYWASKGYLKFEQGLGNDYTLYKTKDIDENSSSYEKTAFNGLWSHGSNGSVSNNQLKDRYYKTISTAKMLLPAFFTGERSLVDAKSKHQSWLSAALVVISVILPCIASALYSMNFAATLPLCAVPIISILFIYNIIHSIEKNWYAKGILTKMSLIIGVVVASTMLFMSSHMISEINLVFNSMLFSVVDTLAIVNIIISVFIARRSDYGHQILERTLGFKDFLETAEKDKLEMLIDENPSYFYDILPYALVLNVTEKWADKFDDLISEPPDWYYSKRGGRFMPRTLYRDMSSAMSCMKSDMTSAPQSSGSSSGSFGGGGHSGGGSGGGGGRSW